MVSLIVPLMLIAFFAAAVLGAPILRRVLKWRLSVFVGLISYPMFLFHRVVILLVRQQLVPTNPISTLSRRPSVR